MYNHMEYLQKCFQKTTAWNDDNIYSNILATSCAMLDFSIPNGSKLEVLSQATNHLASSMTILNRQTINGSLAYLYSSIPIKNSSGTKDISLQDAISGFRIIEPHMSMSSLLTSSQSHKEPVTDPTQNSPKTASLLYGRMYFPGTALEAMLIKKITPNLQLLVKCINNPLIKRNGTIIFYLQENNPRFSREYIYSTNEALIGFRCLYNFGKTQKSQSIIPKFDNSVVSVGTELWYAAMSMSPGLSTAIRYATRSTVTGKPLTMTLSCNPILGHISLTYNVKTSVSSTVCSKYDFNWFSYASNLTLGIELYNFLKNSAVFSSKNWEATSRAQGLGHHENSKGSPSDFSKLSPAPYSIHHDILAPPLTQSSSIAFDPVERRDGSYLINSPLLKNSRKDQEVMSAFQNLVKESNFSSVLKASTSISDRMLKLLWVGRYKDFLVSTGFKLNLNTVTRTPEVGRFGVTFAYAC